MSYLGTNKIGSMYLGTTSIGKAYLGEDLVFQKGGGGILPTGYTQLTYVEAPLYTQTYINTGITATNSTGFYVEALTNDANSGATYGCLFGGRKGSNSSDFQLSTYTATNSGFSGTLRRGTSSQNYNAHITAGTKFTATLSGTSYTMDGTEYTTAASISSGKVIYLFALNNNGTATQYGHFRCYRFKLYSGDTEVLDYVPARRNSDNVVGFYDLVAEAFVAPSSGLLYGVNENLTSYDNVVTYLESTGASRINTGIGCHVGYTKVVIDCQFTSNLSTTQVAVGCTGGDGRWFGNISGYYGVGPKLSVTSDTRTTLTLTFVSTTSTTLTDGNETVTVTGNTTQTHPVCIYCASTGYFAYLRVWSVKVYEGTTLVRDFIPVEKGGVGYFYDNITGLLFPNVGTENFTIGQ